MNSLDANCRHFIWCSAPWQRTQSSRSDVQDTQILHESVNETSWNAGTNQFDEFHQPNEELLPLGNVTWVAYENYGETEYGQPGSPPEELPHLKQVAQVMLVYYTPTVAILGILVNVAALGSFLSHQTLRESVCQPVCSGYTHS